MNKVLLTHYPDADSNKTKAPIAPSEVLRVEWIVRKRTPSSEFDDHRATGGW